MASNQLMRPPLVGKLVCRDEISKVDILIWIEDARDPEGFSEGTGIGEGLRKLPIAGKFKDTELLELVRAVVGLVVVETTLDPCNHVIDIEAVLWRVINLDVDALVALPLNLV